MCEQAKSSESNARLSAAMRFYAWADTKTAR